MLSGDSTLLGSVNSTVVDPDVDLFGIDLAVGDTLRAYTMTPADGEGEFANGLDPILSLWDDDPSSVDPIISNDNSGELGGHNALLDYVVPLAGYYYIELGAAGNPGTPQAVGEYILSVNVTPAPPTPGITVTPTSGLETTESGGMDYLQVVLNAPPTDDVMIGFSSSDPLEGIVSPTALTFTPENWDNPQTVTITGVDDSLVDGDILYTILTDAAVSADTDYLGLNPEDVSVTNIDNDSPSEPTTVSVTSISYGTQAGKGGNRDLVVTVSLENDLGDPVEGAVVSVDVYGPGFVDSQEGTTGPDGTAVFILKLAPAGEYTTDVINVSAAGLTWDEITPTNSYSKL